MLLGVFEYTSVEVRGYVLEQFGGYRLGRAVGLMGFKGGETLPVPE